MKQPVWQSYTYRYNPNKQKKRMKKQLLLMRTLAVLTVAIAAFNPSFCASGETSVEPTWYKSFVSPQKEACPWTFWYWMYGCVTDEGIRLDLKAMHEAGISGFYLMPIKGVEDGKQYGGTANQLSPEWWKRMQTVFTTADSLGLEMGLHFSDGFALGGGPWIEPAESMQKVVWSDTVVSSNKGVITVERPHGNNGYYEDIGTYAIPATYADDRKPAASVSFPFRSSEPCDIVMSYETPFTLRRVRVITGGNNYQAHRLSVYSSTDGSHYRFVRTLTPARQGWQNTDANATYSIPETTARYFKFHWTPDGSEPGSEDMDAAKWKPNLKIGGLELGSEPVVDGFEGKSGAVWRVSKAFPLPDSDCVPADKVLRLNLRGDTVSTRLPKGTWRIIRIGHTSTGHTNATGGGGRGLECDKFSSAAIAKQFDNWFANIYRHAPQDIVKRVLKRLHVDSWECGSQNWSSTFAAEFERRRGYDLLPWLPLYAGVPIESSAKSDQVLRDIRQTIADLIADVFFKEVRKLADSYGMKLSTECVAPTMVSDGLRHYAYSDFPMGEFWLNSPTHDKPNDMLDAVSGGHIYGKNIIQAEGFTEVRGTWDEDFATLKSLLDHNYCIGTNGIVFHVNTHNPWTDRAPGMTLDGIGTFFQRDNTWWRELKVFSDYIKRCQSLLQTGVPVTDLALYVGDEMPQRAVLPERLIASLPGLFSAEVKEAERKRKANMGQPLEVSPVGVTHTANLTKASDWVNPLNGYRYDSFNHDALAKSRVENGRLITPGGASYAALVVPQARPMNPDRLVNVWNDIERLRLQGLKVIAEPWENLDLRELGIEPDAVLPAGIDFAHRHSADADIYFLSNQTGARQVFVPQFRERRKYRYTADAVSGEVCKADSTVSLEKSGSLFYILSDTEIASASDSPAIGSQRTYTLDSGKWTISFEKTGRTIETDSLFDWSAHKDNDIKYYSGHAKYSTSFNYKGSKRRVIMAFGEVNNIATVYVNGQLCGTAWCPPYQVDISKAVRKGKNDIEIVVVNTWANALLGNDLGTPPFKGIWTNARYRRADKTLLPAGLTGEITIIEQKKNDK